MLWLLNLWNLWILSCIDFSGFLVNDSLLGHFKSILSFFLQDKYILISMAILCLVCVWHTIVMIVHTHYGEETAECADMIAVIILGGVFIVFQVIYVGLVSGFVCVYFVVLYKSNNCIS